MIAIDRTRALVLWQAPRDFLSPASIQRPAQFHSDLGNGLHEALSAMLAECFPPNGRPGAVFLSLTESPDAYALRAALPADAAPSLQVQFVDGQLAIRGARRSSHGVEPFSHSLRLPPDAAAAEASSEDGVLTITVARKPANGLALAAH